MRSILKFISQIKEIFHISDRVNTVKIDAIVSRTAGGRCVAKRVVCTLDLVLFVNVSSVEK